MKNSILQFEKTYFHHCSFLATSSALHFKDRFVKLVFKPPKFDEIGSGDGEIISSMSNVAIREQGSNGFYIQSCHTIPQLLKLLLDCNPNLFPNSFFA